MEVLLHGVPVAMPDKPFTFFENSDIVLNTGLLFVTQLHDDSNRPDAPPGLINDWNIMAKYIGHEEGELEPNHILKVEDAWASYLASGVAPSLDLESVFSSTAKEKLAAGSKRLPPDVTGVFDRLLTTDEKIAEKRAADNRKVNGRKLPVSNYPSPELRTSWWRRQTAMFRLTVFVSGAWIAFMQIYARIFDPFHVGGWEEMGDAEIVKLQVVSVLPLVIAALYWAYRKWVR